MSLLISFLTNSWIGCLVTRYRNIAAVINPKINEWVIPLWVKMKNSGSKNPIKIKIKSKSADVPPKLPSIGHLDPIKNKIMKGIRKCVKRSMG